MIKVLAQTKNLRRGHATQGKLKKIHIDETEEGYANFMAPRRMQYIRQRVKDVMENAESRIKKAKKELASEEADSEKAKAKGKDAQDAAAKKVTAAKQTLSQEEAYKQDAEELKTILDAKVLQPETETYLTPEWDEMVPFPSSTCSPNPYIHGDLAPNISTISSMENAVRRLWRE